jgi:sugar O-acyltransferase (sialic acid O-acetyltransferase NeuD family)
MHDLIIVGAGGFGRELRQLVQYCFPTGSYRIKGFLSSNPRDLEGHNVAEPIIDDPHRYSPRENDRFLLAVGDIEHRKSITTALKTKGATFLSMVHPTALVDNAASIGEGCVIYPYAIVMNEARLDDFVLLNLYASAGHDTQVGKYCNLCPYATMNGFAVLEDEVYMGTHSSLLPECRVGRGSKISAGSVAAHNVEPYSLVFGVPGKHVPLVRK